MEDGRVEGQGQRAEGRPEGRNRGGIMGYIYTTRAMRPEERKEEWKCDDRRANGVLLMDVDE
jgi:hypothetical protein